ncbi:hypothetical protein OG599_34685 (plasmid) [Streptomyces sp. NBC_01335]|uniref:hypothetical protein n=1 Tax=Streptomyces sp. NBC_01335 TaxID=2903828 RepID=UPI002E113813|nr:hypothetical protein OG599_34685 [Streptomyces sp. NBC_01335]
MVRLWPGQHRRGRLTLNPLPIRTARGAQYRAARAAVVLGLAHPLTRVLLAAAAAAAATAWDAGHPVADIHPRTTERHRTGRPLFERLCRLQDAYLNDQRS